MRIFVAGGTGAQGRPLVRKLVEAGHDVVATTSHPQKLGSIEALGGKGVVMDGLDAGDVSRAVVEAKPDAVVHQMTALASLRSLRNFDKSFAATNELRTRGTGNLLNAAIDAGARRLVVQSYAGWPSGKGATLITEDEPFDPHPLATQRRSLQAIEELERLVTGARDIEGIALRYGTFYGPGASDALIDLVRKRMFPLIGDGAGVWSFIHMDDGAEAVIAALDHGQSGAYNIVDDDPAPASEWLPYFARTIGARPPLRLPVWLGRLIGGEALTAMMTDARGVSNEKAKRELGWKPRWSSWREGFAQALTM